MRLLRGIRMVPAAQESCKRKSTLSYDPMNPLNSPPPRRRREVISDAYIPRESTDCSYRCNANCGCTLTFSRHEECFPRFSMSIIYSYTLDLWGKPRQTVCARSRFVLIVTGTHVKMTVVGWRVLQKWSRFIPSFFWVCCHYMTSAMKKRARDAK